MNDREIKNLVEDLRREWEELRGRYRPIVYADDPKRTRKKIAAGIDQLMMRLVELTGASYVVM